MNWNNESGYPGYTFYGVKTLSHAARTQPRGSMLCWAYAFGALLGVNPSTVATFTVLDATFLGQLIKDTDDMVKAFNSYGQYGSINPLTPWYDAHWGTAQLEQHFPQATITTGHVIVALAIGRHGSDPTKEEQVRYWDPADAQIHTVGMTVFNSKHPTKGYVKA
ncbi:hypothetical protein ABIA31_007399 [Catenulispora sp. MAP5-51]|uniref:hypothetical protein n=1 Tax=Catenulispora sp. MAP5-51 TaxID=3156298 RepID=UPI0035170638